MALTFDSCPQNLPIFHYFLWTTEMTTPFLLLGVILEASLPIKTIHQVHVKDHSTRSTLTIYSESPHFHHLPETKYLLPPSPGQTVVISSCGKCANQIYLQD